MSDSVNVYLDREALAETVLRLMMPISHDGSNGTVFATATELNGVPTNPASLIRVHRYVEEQMADVARYGEDEEAEMDRLKELFGDDWAPGSEGEGTLTAEEADPDADQAIAHRIIVALATAFPLPAEQRAALPVAE
ncbi:hypothetical protein ABR737_00655 [Streptomyces sp. Edi2]|uniref:hypothetical protein n=1 Tax=Streptomyces sp. Edi2 TaxID=3162528 RepID=UPI0033064F46